MTASRTFAPGRLPRRTATLLVLVVLMLAPSAAVESLAPRATPLSLQNRSFVSASSYANALARFDHRSPPLYPSLLYVGHAAGLPLQRIQQGLFAITLVLLLAAVRRNQRPLPALGVVAGYAVCAFNVYPLGQLWPETLVVPLALGLWIALDGYARSPGWGSLLLATTLVSLACLTRTFCLFWLVPIATIGILRSATSARTRVRHGLVFAAGVLLPFGLWTARVYARTGFLTGMERLSWETRPLAARNPIWPELTGWDGTLLLGAKTLCLDFISPTRLASHAGLTAPLTSLEIALASLGVVALLLATRHGTRRSSPPGTAPATFVGVYLLAVFGLWSVSNNDPLWSRFLLPCYVFVVAGVAHQLTRAGDPGASVRARLLCWLCAAGWGGLQGLKWWALRA